jgi:hypothetical protein
VLGRSERRVAPYGQMETNTVTSSFEVNGQGTVPNFTVVIVFHVTINSGGIVRSEVFNLREECR